MTTDNKVKIVSVAGLIGLTVGIHYGWLLEPLFGESHWIHAIHGRFCYIPIVVAATFFGMRGGLWAAAAISALVMPFVLSGEHTDHNLAGEIVEILFYFAIAILTGALTDRERISRRRHEQAQLQLERSHKLSMVGRMAAGVAHEIKNPLASIKGGVEIICSDSTGNDERQEFRDIVGSEIKRIDGTVQEFLDFARPRESQPEEIDLSEVVAAGVRQIESQASSAGVTVAHISGSGVVVSADREKIHQVLLNLLLNAIDASVKGGKINVNVSAVNDSAATMTVRDFGQGVNSADSERIFEPFYTSKTKGSGLGLAIVKSIVESHQGTVELGTVSGPGALFRVTLPLSKVNR
ncbi:MAG: ATP-binding protein [candidate division Zixibacteria bacterium]|nr:ATP-binding protein [candidate division Zixibacteria bacterium]MDH3937167.1 ATP-binding protein [candidate division Zixibacteria bacterium]MDH4034165.1 ATP-binding protein [candidate division Zixibacteria bacterium]